MFKTIGSTQKSQMSFGLYIFTLELKYVRREYRLTEMNSKEYLEQHAEMIAEKQLQTQRNEDNTVHVVQA